VEKLLIFLLSHDNDRVKLAASQATAAMAENLVSRDTIGKLGYDCFCICVFLFCLLTYYIICFAEIRW